MSFPLDAAALGLGKPARKKASPNKRGTKADRRLALQIAATGYYDSPKEVEARAQAYLNFIVYGPAKPPARKPRRRRK